MIARSGEVIAIDSVSASMPFSGNGLPWSPLGISGVKTISAVSPLFVKETEDNIVFGCTDSIKPVYFSGNLSNNIQTKYFTINNGVLSASPEVEYFNLALNYKVNLDNTRNPDFVYESTINVNSNNVNVHSETHYVDGVKNTESYSTNLNLKNNSPFTFNLVQDQGISSTTIALSCLGFVTTNYNTDIDQFIDETVSGYRLVGWDPVINVLGGNEPDEYIDFGDNKALEV